MPDTFTSNGQPTTVDQDSVDYVMATQAALCKSAEFINEATAKTAACKTLIPKVVEAMVQGQRIKVAEREDYARRLEDPRFVLDQLAKTAVHRNRDETQALLDLGKPEGGTQKRASSPPEWIGSRRLNSEADRAYDAAFGHPNADS